MNVQPSFGNHNIGHSSGNTQNRAGELSRRRLVGIALGIAGAGAATVIGLKHERHGESSAASTNPEAEAQPDLSEVISQENITSATMVSEGIGASQEIPEVSPEERYGISVEKYTDAQALALAHTNALTDWYRDGANKENGQRWLDSPKGIDDAALEIAEESDGTHIKALFVEGWEQSPNLLRSIQADKEIHEKTLRFYFQTAMFNDPEDTEPYERSVVFLGAREIDSIASQEIEATTTYTYTDNSDKNRAAELMNGKKVTDNTVYQIITWVNQDGYWKISDIQAND